eukprot:scaffold14316_cov116-Isochrysis_galbana.AAC.4
MAELNFSALGKVVPWGAVGSSDAIPRTLRPEKGKRDGERMGEGRGSVRTAKGQRVSRRDAAKPEIDRDRGAESAHVVPVRPRDVEHISRAEDRLIVLGLEEEGVGGCVWCLHTHRRGAEAVVALGPHRVGIELAVVCGARPRPGVERRGWGLRCVGSWLEGDRVADVEMRGGGGWAGGLPWGEVGWGMLGGNRECIGSGTWGGRRVLCGMASHMDKGTIVVVGSTGAKCPCYRAVIARPGRAAGRHLAGPGVAGAPGTRGCRPGPSAAR